MPQAIGLAIGGLLFNLGAPLALVNFFAIGAGGSLLFGLGLTALNAAFAPRPAAVRPSDGQVAIRQAVPPRMITYGRRLIGGAVFWFDVSSGELYLGQVVNARRISQFVTLYIDDNAVTTDGSNNITTSPYSSLTGSKKLITHVGLATETEYAEIASAFGTSDVRGDGVASMLLVVDNFASSADQLENFPNGKPELKALIDGSLVYDWRDADQDRDDPTTWGFSENPVVVLADFMTAATGFGRPWSEISGNLDAWTAAADICDEPVLSLAAGDTEARYRIGLTYVLTDAPKEVALTILRTFDGRLWQKRDGTLGIAAGRFVAPTVTITDDHFVSGELTRGQDTLAAIAGVRAQYLSPSHDYREQDAEPWPDGATVGALSDERVAHIDLTSVPSHAQARRLMKRAALRAAAPWRGSIRTSLYGLKALDERFIRLELTELGIATSFEVTDFRLDLAALQVELQLVAVDASIDAWSPAAEEGTAPTIPEGLVVVDKDAGTRFGNMTAFGSGGLAAAFDDDRNQGSGDCAVRDNSSDGYVGKSFSTGKAFGKAIIYGSNNQGFHVGGNSTVTLTWRGKNGTPSNSSDGTSLGSVSFVDTGDESGGREITSSDQVTTYTHQWVQVTRSGGGSFEDLAVAEIDLWEWKAV